MFLRRIEAERSSDVGDEDKSSTAQSTLHKEVSNTSDVIVSIEYEYGVIEIRYGDVVDEHLTEKPNHFPVRLEEETGIVDVFCQGDELKFDESPLLEKLKRSVEKEGDEDKMTTKSGKRAKIVRKSLVASEYSEDMTTDSDSDFE